MSYQVFEIKRQIKNDPNTAITDIYCIDERGNRLVFPVRDVIEKIIIDGKFFFIKKVDIVSIEVGLVVEESSSGDKYLRSDPKYSAEDELSKLPEFY